MTVLTGDFSFPDRKWNDQVERLEPKAIHVTHWDIGLFGYLKTGSSGHCIKWTTVWASKTIEGREQLGILQASAAGVWRHVCPYRAGFV